MRKTKIICTLGPATDNEKTLRELMLAGMDVARLNFSHQTHPEQKVRADMVKKLRKELDLPVALLLDTKGPEIRIKTFKTPKVELKAGGSFTLTTRDVEGDSSIVSITFANLPSEVHPGGRILIDDGLIELRVESCTDTDILCTVINGGIISSRKSINVPGAALSLPFISEQDEKDIAFAVKEDFDFIAASFTRSAQDILDMRAVLEKYNSHDIRIIAKIENSDGVENIDEIIEVSDGIMVARGDLGVEIPLQEIPVIQKKLIKKAYNAGRQVITATQMLDSMMKNPRPTRAEVSDVANAVYDGTGAVMLSGETAAGLYPVEAVEAMAAIALSTEENINYQNRLREEAPSAVPSVTSSISYATCTTATSLHCAAIIPVSKSGRTARMISRFRPPVPIICCTNSVRSQRRLSLVWGVCPLVVPEADSTDALFAGAVEAAQKAGLVKNGDMVVLTAGLPLGVSGTTNLLKVEVIGDLLLSGTGVTRKCVTGPVVVCKDAQEALKSVSSGDILAVPYTTNEMMPAIRRLSGLITEQGGLDSHAATSALALDIPAVVGAVNATALLKSGSCVTLDAATGTVCAATKEA